jgi:threonine/homoserine/homoserine lactone efflux protein
MLLQAAALGFSAGASPGPFQALLLERAARVGPRRALHLALVPLASDAPAVLTCLFALSSLPLAFLEALRLLGGALLVWMGAGTLRDVLRPAGDGAGDGAAAPPPRDRGFWQATLLNLLNPNVWLFWSLVGAPLLAGALRHSPGQAALFLAGFYLPLTATNGALVLAFGAVGRLGPRAARSLGGLSSAAFLVLGLAQLWRAALG